MAGATELEAYMDKNEERYFALFPDQLGVRRENWLVARNYIHLVKSGKISGITPETETPYATQTLVGLRRILGDEPHPRRAIPELQKEPVTPGANTTDLEVYMDRNEARFFALFPDPQHVERVRWANFRGYIDRVRRGEFSGIALETPNPRAAQALVGFRRTIGEEPHPRKAIRRRQQLTLATAVEAAH
jgi:hypothetical protein